jgi:hypothetical protein
LKASASVPTVTVGLFANAPVTLDEPSAASCDAVADGTEVRGARDGPFWTPRKLGFVPAVSSDWVASATQYQPGDNETDENVNSFATAVLSDAVPASTTTEPGRPEESE